MTNKKKIIWICLLIVIVLIATTYFLFFQPKHTIILYIEGIEAEELIKYAEQLPNLKNLSKAKLETQVPLNNPSAFSSIFSGKYIYEPWYLKNSADYCAEKENDFSKIFNNTALSQYVQEKKQKIYFFNTLDWQTEKKIHQRDFSSSEIIQQAQENFLEQKNKFLEHLENRQENWLIAGFNYPALVAQVSKDDQEVFQAYQAIDNLVAQVQNLMKKNTSLYLISPFGLVEVKESIDLNRALSYRGFLKTAKDFKEDYFLSDCDLSNSYAYSPRAGEIFINQAGREKQGKVQEDYSAVIEDTAYVLNFIDYQGDNLIDTQLYDTKEYFNQDDIGELLIAMPEGYNTFWPEQSCFINKDTILDSMLIKDHLNIKPDLIPGLILMNKKFVEDLDQSGEVQEEINYLNILNLIIEKNVIFK